MQQSEPFVGLSVSAFAHGLPRRLLEMDFGPSRDHLPLPGCFCAPSHGSLRGPCHERYLGSSHHGNALPFPCGFLFPPWCWHRRSPRMEPFLRSGRGRVPSFALGPVSGAREWSRARLGGSGVFCPLFLHFCTASSRSELPLLRLPGALRL